MADKIIGLTHSEVTASRATYGENVLEKEKTKSFFRRFLENLNDPIIKILIGALIIELIFTLGHCNLFEIFGIVAAILIATVVSTLSELGSERAFRKIKEDAARGQVKVLRDGEISEIPTEELVVGDIMYIARGERISADGTVVYGRVFVDQSALNGESREVSKTPYALEESFDLLSRSKVFSGTEVADGEAIVRVGRVGASTYYGMVAHDVQAQTRESPLKIRLSRLARQISKIGYFVAALVAFIYLFVGIVVDNNFEADAIITMLSDGKRLFSLVIHALTLVITIIVVAVPEGLPMMITVVLCANMKRMFSDSILVKKPVGIETAGSMNILFTDKTGTVTVGAPKIERIEGIDGTYKSLSSLKGAPKILTILTENALYNTDSQISGGCVIGGNGTDRAIAEFFKSCDKKMLKITAKEPFSSEKKYSSVTVEGRVTYIKGAPERIIALSEYGINSRGEVVKLDKDEITARLYKATSAGGRAVAVGYKDESSDYFVLVALIVLRDQLRRDSKDAIRIIRQAGVQTVMLTGDGVDTATAIATECGILSGGGREVVLTSDELSEMSDDEVKTIIPRLRVLARALPQDKTRLVRLSQELELVVGMTGDGINDAPALKLADVGFAMGNGADIAKSAADVVILNNSLTAISRTILYGRTIFKSIRKFITFQLIMNFAACGISVLGPLLGVETPITIIQMLWVNIIMDTLGGLAFSGEPALEYYMKERPKRRDEPILTRDMLVRIIVMGSYTLTICIAFLKGSLFKEIFVGLDYELRFLTAFYALFIFLGIFNSFAARCERMWVLSNIGKNKPFVFIMALIAAVQIIMIFHGGEVFRSAPLYKNELGMVILLALSIIPFDTARRIFTKAITKHA